MVGTTLNYVYMRLLAGSRDDPVANAARDRIDRHLGAGGIQSWDEFWLAVLDVYDLHGLDP